MKVECPSCLGTKEDLNSVRKRPCPLCEGKGEVDEDVANGFISNLSYEGEEDLI